MGESWEASLRKTDRWRVRLPAVVRVCGRRLRLPYLSDPVYVEDGRRVASRGICRKGERGASRVLRDKRGGVRTVEGGCGRSRWVRGAGQCGAVKSHGAGVDYVQRTICRTKSVGGRCAV